MTAIISPLTAQYGVWHEVSLYLDDATHTYATQSVNDGAAARVASISPISIELGSQYGGASIGSVSVKMLNVTARGTQPSRADLEFSRLLDNVAGDEWLNRKIVIQFASRSSSGAVTRSTLFTGALTDVQISGQSVDIKARSLTSSSYGTVTPVQITAGIFVNAPTASIGQYIPIILGTPDGKPASGIPGPVPAYIIDDTNRVIACASHETSNPATFNLWYFDGTAWAAVPSAAINVRDEADASYIGAGTITTITLNASGGGYTYDSSHIFATDLDGMINGVPAVITDPIEALIKVAITYTDLIESDFITVTTTAGAFVIGVRYTIATTGTTDFTLIGAADSNPGTVFTATGAGTGTGTATSISASEAMLNNALTVATVIDAPIDFKTLLAELTGAFDIDSYFTREGKIIFDYFEITTSSPTVYTDTSHFYGMPKQTYNNEVGDGRRALANQYTAEYDYNWLLSAYYSNTSENDYTAQASMQRVYRADISNNYVSDSGVMQTILLHKLLYRSKPLQKITLSMSPEIIPDVNPTDIIGLTHYAGLNASGGGWDSVPVRVESIQYVPDKFIAHIEAIRTSPWTDDAYIFHGQEIQILDGSDNITLSVGNNTVAGLSAANLALLAEGNIIEINSALNTIAGYVQNIGGGTFDIEDDAAGGAPVNALANETTTEYTITKNYAQGSAEDQTFGALAEAIIRYQAGTVSTTAGSAIVTGAGTAFIGGGVVAGDEIDINNGNGPIGTPMSAIIEDVISSTQLRLSALAPSSESGVTYTIYETPQFISGTLKGKRL